MRQLQQKTIVFLCMAKKLSSASDFITVGGFSPNGVSGMHPDDYATHFLLNGSVVDLCAPNQEYVLDGAPVTVLGLAYVGTRQGAYDRCYVKDYDNYIDIILSGSRQAVAKINRLEMPAVALYAPVCNQGGPGCEPSPMWNYSQPSPAHGIDVQKCLDDPKMVSYIPPTDTCAPAAPTAASPTKNLSSWSKGGIREGRVLFCHCGLQAPSRSSQLPRIPCTCDAAAALLVGGAPRTTCRRNSPRRTLRSSSAA